MCLNPLIHLDEDTYKILTLTNKNLINYVPFCDLKKDFWYSVNRLHLTNKLEFFSCRKCSQCLAVKKLDWVKRLEIEKQRWDYAYFITLTFDDLHYSQHTKKRLLSYWCKNHLKKLLGKGNFKYFAVSEYGSHTNRFHYHMILFTNYLFDDMEALHKSKRGNLLYVSDWLRNNWNYGFHQINICDSIASFKYCVKYTTKEQDLKIYVSRGLGDYYDTTNIDLSKVPKSTLRNAYARVWNARKLFKTHKITAQVLFNVIKENERYNALHYVLKVSSRIKSFTTATITPQILSNEYYTRYLHCRNTKQDL